ncbi:hypothetical protein GUJ93_ZPchr0011g27049 [Zizania palustris]|uniref:Uncharacterized protein n=1 Tax=Zizania palustris TaxID=103762 RepID=A0A8J5WE96_ZIZPA|nr:hypothetical protein GUJ93_ZPchr0011g27049 [Zizania palustris]
MWSSSDSGSDSDEPVAAAAAAATALAGADASPARRLLPPATDRRQRQRNRRRRRAKDGAAELEGAAEAEAEAEDVWRGLQREAPWPRRAARPVVEEATADGVAWAGEGGMGRAKSLTDDDLEELKGCVDLGFGFSYDEIPELCGTLPALELCYSMSQRFLDEHQSPPKPEKKKPVAEATAVAPASPAQPIANWKISSPGDSPDEVKARLKYWAQAVACTVRLCS